MSHRNEFPARLFCVLLAGLFACAKSTPAPAVPAPPGPAASQAEFLREAAPALRLPGDVEPLRYEIALRVDPREERFEGDVAIEVELTKPRETLWLHALALDVTSAKVRDADGVVHEARFEVVDEDGLAGLRLPVILPPGPARLELRYTAAFGTKLRGLYKVVQDEQAYAFTQFEPLAAREVFPCFDEPRFKTPFDVRLTVPEGQVAIANTRESRAEPAAGGSGVTHVFATTEPLPTYLVAFAVGPLDVVEADPIAANSLRERPVPLRGVAVQGRGEEMAYALAQTPAILEALEEYFGIAYPYDKLDILAVPDFAAGAMENAGAITFREYFLLFGEEVPERQRRLFAEVMAHELAHQWFGNLVTMPFWDDIWLNEAFATWMAARTIDSLHPEYELNLEELRYTHWAMRVDERQSARAIRQPIESSHDIENAFDAITYTKGGAVLNMFEQYIGPETFRAALRAYLREHAYGSATAEDLVSAMSEAAGQPLEGAFFSFLTQPGVPLVRASAQCEGSTLKVALAQSRYVPLGGKASDSGQWQMPVCIRYGGPAGADTHCEMVRQPRAELAIAVQACPSWWMPNADARGYYRWAIPAKDYASLTSKRGWSALDEREQQSVVESLTSSLRAGEAAPADVYPSLLRLVAEGDRHVLSTALSPLSFAADHLLEDEGRARYRARLAAAVVPRLKRLGYRPRKGEAGEQALLRRTLVSVACLEAKDPGCRKRLGRAGRARLGLDDGESADVPADLIGIALEVAVQDGGEAAFERAVEELFASSSSIERSRLLGALGSVTDPDLAARARDLTLDPRLKVNEVRLILGEQSRTREQHEAAWEWLLAHLSEVAERTPSRASGQLVSLAKGFCSQEAVERVREQFAPYVEQLAGAPRELSNTLEAIGLCAARADALRESARAFFAK